MDFDLLFCVAYLKNESSFPYSGFDWEIIRESDSKDRLQLKSEYWDKAVPYSNLFRPIEEGKSYHLILNREYYDFFDKDVIDRDIVYKVMSTLCIDIPYKWLLFTLKKMNKSVYVKQMLYLKCAMKREEYEKLLRIAELYDNSIVLYDYKINRVSKFKRMNKNRLTKRSRLW